MEQTTIRVKELTQEPEWAFGLLRSKSGTWYFNGAPGDYRELGIDPPYGLTTCEECGGLFPSWREGTIRCPSCSVKPLVSPSTPVDGDEDNPTIGVCKYCEGDVYPDDEFASDGFCSALCRHKHALSSEEPDPEPDPKPEAEEETEAAPVDEDTKAVNSPPRRSSGYIRIEHPPRTCVECGKTFTPRQKNQITCSKECGRIRTNRYEKQTHEPKQCVQCGKTFTPTRKDSRYCSVECYSTYSRTRTTRKPKQVAPTSRPPKQVATPTPAPIGTKQPAYALVAIDASYDEAINKAMELGLFEVLIRGRWIKIGEIPNTGG